MAVFNQNINLEYDVKNTTDKIDLTQWQIDTVKTFFLLSISYIFY